MIFFRKFKRENEPLSFEESEYRALLMKQWHKVKSKQHHTELSILSTAMEVQMNALNSLRQESEALYQQAIQVFNTFIIILSFYAQY